MRKSDEPLTDTLVRCLADPTDLKGLERLENDGDQAGARLMRARLADQAAVRLDAALEDNRARVRRQLGRDWAWATDEVMSDLTIRTIRRLDYWHRTNTDRDEGGATSVLLQCLFDRFGSVFPQCGLMVFPGVVIVSR